MLYNLFALMYIYARRGEFFFYFLPVSYRISFISLKFFRSTLNIRKLHGVTFFPVFFHKRWQDCTKNFFFFHIWVCLIFVIKQANNEEKKKFPSSSSAVCSIWWLFFLLILSNTLCVCVSVFFIGRILIVLTIEWMVTKKKSVRGCQFQCLTEKIVGKKNWNCASHFDRVYCNIEYCRP